MTYLLELLGRFSHWITHDPAATVWREWLNFLVSVAIAIIAVWQDRIRAWFNKPKVSLLIQTGSPFSDLTILDAPIPVQNPDETVNIGALGSAKCYYFRLLIANTGKATAERVEVFVQSVERLTEGQQAEALKDFPPMNLTWSHSGGVPKDLSPGMSKFIDLGCILDPAALKRQPPSLRHQYQKWNTLADKTKTIFTFELEVKPNHLGHIVEAGRYRIRLLTSGGNFDPFETQIEMKFTGEWFGQEENMYGQGFELTKMSPIKKTWMERIQLRIRGERQTWDHNT